MTGKPYANYVKEHIFDVLGMNHTSIDPSRKDLPNIDQLPKAIGYFYKSDGKFKSFTKPYQVLCYPAGSAIGPVGDLSLFIKELVPTEGHKSKLFQKEETLRKFLNFSFRKCEDCT